MIDFAVYWREREGVDIYHINEPPAHLSSQYYAQIGQT